MHGVKHHLLVKLYKSVVRPIFDYGCSAYADASISQLAKLDILQHRTLCKALGVMRLSHRASVNIEAHTVPLHIGRKAYILKYSRHNDISRNSPLNLRKRVALSKDDSVEC